jgi:hypothetical protein
MSNGKVSLAQDKESSGSYIWILPKEITSSHYLIFLKLIDDENQEWRKKFYPQITVEMPSSPIARSMRTLRGDN